MRTDINWAEVPEATEFEQPVPGAYIAVIRKVEDVEDKEYLAIYWDFAEGTFKGENQATYDRAGFWPTIFRRSYKDKALRFFKAFKTSVELSNKGYVFDARNIQGLVGKYFGVVLGEEEYRKNNGEIGKRLYVARERSIQAIQDGDFNIPELKKLTSEDYYLPTPARSQKPRNYNAGFSDFEDDGDGSDLPF